MQSRIRKEWAEALAPAFEDPSMAALSAFLRERIAGGAEVYPPMGEVFAALNTVAPDDVRVCVIGQDPFHGAGQAHGLAFSVRPGVRVPPSLANIHQELVADLGVPNPSDGSLLRWADQGVLLLNTLLTVESGQPLSHKGRGWERFTDAVVAHVARSERPTVFMLWGTPARKKAARFLDGTRHLVIQSPHPSPLSAHTGFLGSRPFSRANAFLETSGRGAIDWRLD